MIFWDTSALLPAYDRSERGHEQIVSLLTGPGPHAGSLLLKVEAAGVIGRRFRTASRTRDRMLEQLLRDLRHFHLVPLDADAVEGTLRVIRAHGLRGADAVHLAAAVWTLRETRPRGMRMATSDREQARAARAEGLRVIEF